uniref:Uncharacterized protein n=1 Tax=Anguilla anguilla TaxID=7936 RepID=A0A0E9SIZ4_ANGAN
MNITIDPWSAFSVDEIISATISINSRRWHARRRTFIC